MYYGQWKEDKWYGKCRMIFYSGNVFTGQINGWINNGQILEMEGTMVYPD